MEATADAVTEFRLTHHFHLIIKNAVPGERNGIWRLWQGTLPCRKLKLWICHFKYQTK